MGRWVDAGTTAGVIQQARRLLSSSSAHAGARSVHYHSQRLTMTRMVKPLTETELHPELNPNGGGGARLKRRRGGGGAGVSDTQVSPWFPLLAVSLRLVHE